MFLIDFDKFGRNSAPTAPPELSPDLSVLIFAPSWIGGHEEVRKVARFRDHLIQKNHFSNNKLFFWFGMAKNIIHCNFMA